MSNLIRLVNKGIKHLFIIDGENLGDGSDQSEDCLPDSLCDGQFEVSYAVLAKSKKNTVRSVNQSVHNLEMVKQKTFQKRINQNVLLHQQQSHLNKSQTTMTSKKNQTLHVSTKDNKTIKNEL